MKLPLEEIDGKMYQPVECEGISPIDGWCSTCDRFEQCKAGDFLTECSPRERADGKNVYFIEVTE